MTSASLPKKILLKTRVSFALPTKFFPKETLQTAINTLVYGVKVAKHYNSAKLFHICIFYILEDDSSYLQWLSHVKPYIKTRIDVKNIRNITDDPRFDSKIAKKFTNLKEASKLLFIVLDENKHLILKFKEEKLKLLFWQGLQHFSKVSNESEAFFGDFRKTLANRLFIMGDKDGSKTLEFLEVKKILRKLRIEVSSDMLSKVFTAYDRDHNNNIDHDEFQKMIEDITLKTELKAVFRKYSSAARNKKDDKDFGNVLMQFDEFKEFLIQEQKQDVSHSEFKQMLKLFNKDFSSNFLKEESKNNFSMMDHSDIQESLNLTFSEFCTIIFSKNNEIFEPEKLEVYQNMTRPLTDYYIFSSHNTYLLNNQLTGKSSTKAYIDAFEKGCRCVELDCWEGEKGEPIIYHGYTLTSKILFRDVIKTIHEYAFETNPYPVILSLENHCSKQQDVMADILQEVLGDSLYVFPENYLELTSFPSPEQLKYRVLVKNKASLPIIFNEQYFSGFKVDWNALDDDGLLQCDDNEEYLPSKNTNLCTIKASHEWSSGQRHFIHSEESQPSHFPLRQNSIARNLFKTMSGSFELNGQELSTSLNNVESGAPSKFKTMSSTNHRLESNQHLNIKLESNQVFNTNNDNKGRLITSKKPSQQHINFDLTKQQTIMIIDSNSKLTSTKKTACSAKLKKLLAMYGVKMSLLLPRAIWNVSSITEDKFEKMCKEEDDQLQDFLRHYFLRTYPSGKRVDSSNYDPIKAFTYGVQMIALNMQTPDLPLLLYISRFRQNGGRFSGYVLKPDYLLRESHRYIKDFTKITNVIF